jgi:AMP-polyphosphate phosphotransferase
VDRASPVEGSLGWAREEASAVFEVAEVGASVAKDAYREAEPGLRVDLINAQYDLREAPFPVIVLLAGDDRTGCQEVLNLIHHWMDARYIDTWVFGRPSDEERERPRFWRYWRALPPRGRIGLMSGAWMTRLIADRVAGRVDDPELQRRLEHVRRFERTLLDDGAVFVKLWLHLPKKEFKKRFRKARKEDAEWRIDEEDWRVFEVYDEAMPVVEQAIQATNQADAAWELVESTDDRHRNLAVARAILAGITAGLARPEPPAPEPPALPEDDAPRKATVLDGVDLTKSLDRATYRERLEAEQRRLVELSRRARRAGVSSVLVFEGWDAAGKGGVIRRITQALDAQDYRVVPISAPTDEENAHPYLWRFWRHLPRAGSMLIFDRSWYGRVLVERVEGFARPDAWERAYGEISDFEAQLVEHGMPVSKFWLHIDREEQLRRFEAREKTPYKKYKITDDDYRNRQRWPLYEEAVHDMVARTSTELAPWHLIPAADKRFARVAVLAKVADALEQALGNAKDKGA